MSNILNNQNLENNLKLLAAQRQINSNLKFKRGIVRFFSLSIFMISFLVLHGVITVSYTHLDVYKRQTLSRYTS